MSYNHFNINDRICIGEYLRKGYSICYVTIDVKQNIYKK